MEQQVVLNFWALQSIPFQISEQGKVFCTPAYKIFKGIIVSKDQLNQESNVFNDILFPNYLGFCDMRGAVWIHYGFKIWPPPNCNTLTYLQFSKNKCK